MELAIPIIAVALIGIIAAIIWGRPFRVQAGGFRRGQDTDEVNVVGRPETFTNNAPAEWDWPSWPVTREHGDRQPQARSYKANR